MSRPDYDLIIIGGGLVGASLALALSKTDLSCAVVEAVAFETDDQTSYDARIIALSHGSKCIFQTMELWLQIEKIEATAIKTIHVSDRGHGGFSRIKHGDHDVAALGYVVPARVLGHVLLTAVKQQPAISRYIPRQVESIKVDSPGVELVLDDNTRLSARLAVIADGGRSRLRGLAGIASSLHDYKQTAVLSNVTSEFSHQGCAYERFTNSGPLALLPRQHDLNSVVWTTRSTQADSVLALSDDDFLAGLQQRFGDRLGRLSKPSQRHSYPLNWVKVPNPVQPRVVVVGNAAHTTHPIAGQGFNLGLRDVVTLAEVLHQADLNQQDIGSLAVLNRYKQWRQNDVRFVSRFTDGLVKLFSTDFPAAVMVRNLGLSLMDISPGIKHHLAESLMGHQGKLPQLARGLPL